jgi:hypothetical protein
LPGAAGRPSGFTQSGADANTGSVPAEAGWHAISASPLTIAPPIRRIVAPSLGANG